MMQFEIELEMNGLPAKFKVEELDPWPDADGFVRYSVSGDKGHSIMAIHQVYWEKPFIMTEQDAWDYLERILYPELPRVYSEDLVFTKDEQELIGNVIGKYLEAIKS